MKTLGAIALASVIVLAATTPADALGGCGGGHHRGPNGRCRPNMHAQMWIGGRYYPGHGYWYDGHWWHNRYRYHHHWRYR